MSARRRVVIVGAAGRDFHNFNVVYRDDERYEVVAFTATQIPNIAGRRYPAELAGSLYPEGIPIVVEADLEAVVREHDVDEVVFAYSDVTHEHVMHLASRAMSAGADYRLLGPSSTMLASSKPVVAVCAVRTGSGKSQTTRRVAQVLREAGKRVAVVRHPMPYGDLVRQRVQRFERYEDFDRDDCTIEEREEFEPHIAEGNLVYAGVDYEAILRSAEQDADVILWDGGNNDFPFYRPDAWLCVVDPHRPGHELRYHPGELNLRAAHALVINKLDSAPPENVEFVLRSIERCNPEAMVVRANSPISLEGDVDLSGKRVLCIEDGPTLTHGEMRYGAAVLAAERGGAAELVDPRSVAVGSIRSTFEEYPEIGTLLPAMGYGDEQVRDLEMTINAAEADVVVIGTPIDLGRIIDINKPSVRVTYRLEEVGSPAIVDVLERRGVLAPVPA